MSDEQDRFDANIASYVQAATARAERAEQRLQAAQAEAVVLREALTLAYGVSLPSRWKKWPKSEAKVKAALSGDAGAAYLREREAMKIALQRCVEVFELSDPSGQWVHLTAPEDAEIDALCRRVGYGAVIDSAARQWRRSDPVGAFTKGACVATVQAAIRQAQDALSAPAAEPEVQP